MATEIELKLKLNQDLSAFIKSLRSLGAVRKCSRHPEKTTMYDNKEGFMQTTDGRLRLRAGAKKTISYKRPITRDGIKKELEYEVEVSDLGVMENILYEIGFVPVSSYDKYREVYQLDEVSIMIDQYPFETYIEIEGDETKIKSLAVGLGFNLAENLTKSCDTLFQEWRKEKGLPPKDFMNFKDYDL